MSTADSIAILIIDDEPEVRRVLRQTLEDEGYSVFEASDKASALAAMDAHNIGLITLDVGLGHASGLDLARELRAKRNVPIIMITGFGGAQDRIAGLEHGADDYITKPFHIREVLLRIRNVLKRYSHPLREADSAPGELQLARRLAFDHCRLDTLTRELSTAQGGSIDLTDFEYRLLTLLLANSGRVVSRSELSMALNGHDWSPFDRTIDGHVARLRRKIEHNEDEPRLIKSVRNVGYVFAGDVTEQ